MITAPTVLKLACKNINRWFPGGVATCKTGQVETKGRGPSCVSRNLRCSQHINFQIWIYLNKVETLLFNGMSNLLSF
jgi:hypothetical protein